MTVHAQRHSGDDRVLVVTLDRPERRNALDHVTLEALRDALSEAATEGVRVCVLRGAGGHFCAGADLTGVEDDGFVTLLRTVLERLHTAPFVTLAAVAGAALGAGTQLAMACDLRLAAADAKFGIPAAKLGLTVDHWTVHQLALAAGPSVARAMLLGAEVFSAEALAATGFVHRLGEPDGSLAWACDLAKLAPLTIAAHKLMANRVEAELADDPEVGAARRAAWASNDFQEGLAAFRERRPPTFTGS
jgi:enoyl-CoA hydratase